MRAALPLPLALALTACSASDLAVSPSAPGATCDLTQWRRPREGPSGLALLVGVGQHRSAEIAPLTGPPADLERVRGLITSPGAGFGFSPETTCALLDEEATYEAVTEALEALAEAAGPDDQVLFYYSGHGAQVLDANGDEPDGLDETLVLYDSRVEGTPDLVDDALNQALARVRERAGGLTVVLDACTSGSATRGAAVLRRAGIAPPSDATQSSVEDPGWLPEQLPGVVLLAAARDGTPALEPGEGRPGYFTDALAEVLSGPDAGHLTWAQVARRVPRALSARGETRQQPVFEGDLDQRVFGGARTERGLWEVAERLGGGRIRLEGVALPGWDVGALVRLHAPGEGSPKASAEIIQYSGLAAIARLLEPDAPAPDPGDHAVLFKPAQAPLQVVLRGSDSPRRQALAGALTQAGFELRASPSAAAFTLSLEGDTLLLLGPEGQVRNRLPSDDPQRVASALRDHATQRTLLQLEGEGGGVFTNQQTLQVRVRPSREQPPCAGSGWSTTQAGVALVPTCGRWHVEVTNTHPSETLRVGGVFLSNDGAIIGLPLDDHVTDLPPGATATLNPLNPIQSIPPTGVPDHLLIVGTRTDVSVRWSRLTRSAARKSVTDSGLEAVLASALSGEKAGAVLAQPVSAWTTTYLAVQVEHNPAARAGAARELTVGDFDVSPFRPAAAEHPLSRVLDQAEALTRYHDTDGVPFGQHGWSADTDAANLARGVDCSRAIWYAFTRAGLPYTDGGWQQGYVNTALMFDAEAGSCRPEDTPSRSPMHDHFTSCLGEPLQTGDVLVWQGVRPGSGACVGHTVMVVDPDDFIGWGSHSWDGSSADDEGVEYQRIKARRWSSWDRKQYKLKACWRHEAFTLSASSARPVVDAEPCSPEACRVR